VITDVPTSQEFYTSAEKLLCLAWDSAAGFFVHLDEFTSQVGPDDVEEDQYWAAAQTNLLNAFVLLQQAAEFFLKSEICSVSPYLLIKNDPSKWPRSDAGNGVPFSKFRTVDAEDLLKIHSVACATQLNDDLRRELSDIREIRNRISHTVDSSLRLTALEIVTTTLRLSHAFSSGRAWIEIAKRHIDAPFANLYGNDDNNVGVARQLESVLKRLAPADTLKYFGFNNRARAYTCPGCYFGSDWSEWDYSPEFAQLTPLRSSKAKNVHCIYCGETSSIVRRKCTTADCLSNVISTEHDACLKCMRTQ